MQAYHVAIQNTVFEFGPRKSGPLLIIFVVSLLFTAAQPEVTDGMPLLPRFAFWIANVSAAVVAILLASAALSRASALKSFNPVAKVLLTGLLASLIAAPLCQLMDMLIPPTCTDDDWIDQLEQQGHILGTVAEFLSVLPMLMPTWLLMNFPLIMKNSPIDEETPKDITEQPVPDVYQPEQLPQPCYLEEREQFFENLPQVIGNDIVTMSSESHYINVQTTLGSCLILGSIKRCADFMGEEGMLVHRSNWVAKKHVERIHISSKTAYCLTSNGLKVPISRSRRKEVKQVFGQAKVH